MHDPWAALRHADYRRFLATHFTTTLAVQLQDVVVAWQMYYDTHDPLALGLVGLAEALPNILVAFIAGHVTDRMERRRLAMTATTVLIACALALAVLAGLPQRQAHWRVLGVYGVLAVSGVARAFLQPSRTALAAAMLPRDMQANAVTWRSTMWQTGAMAGPALGGLCYVTLGARSSYFVTAGLIVAALASLAAIRFRSMPDQSTRSGSMIESLRVGFRFLRGQQALFAAMVLDLFSVLFGGAVALLPIFAADILHVGPTGLGVLRAAPAVGALAMALYLAWRRPLAHAGKAMFQAVFIFGLCIIAFGLSRVFWLSLVLLAVSGAADMVSVVVRSTLLQVLVPDHLMGRVASVYSVFVGSSNEIGSFESGATARLIGTVPAVIAGGAITIGVVGATRLRAPRLAAVGALEQL